jgi:hypothetical protein
MDIIINDLNLIAFIDASLADVVMTWSERH